MSHFLSFGINAAHFAEYSSRIFENGTSKWTFCVEQFFPAKKVTTIKAKSATIALFLFDLLLSSSSLFLFSPLLFLC